MTANPKTVPPGMLAAEALKPSDDRRHPPSTVLFVVEDAKPGRHHARAHDARGRVTLARPLSAVM